MSRSSKPEQPAPFAIAQAEPRRPSGRAILFAGVAGACVLGVGMGLWARPGLHERLAAQGAQQAATVSAPAAARRLEIVVDDHPRGVGTPIDVLPQGMAAAAQAQAVPPPPVQPQFAPARPPEGLIRTHAPAAPPPAAAPHEGPSLRSVLPSITAAFAGARLVLAKLERPQSAEVAEAPATPEPAATPDRKAERSKARELAIAAADAARAEANRDAIAKADVVAQETAQAKAHDAQVARAEAAKAKAHEAQVARAEATKAKAHEAELARAEAAKAKAHEQELARAEAARAAAAKGEAHRLALAKAQAAKVEARHEALARAEAAKVQAAHDAAAKLAQAREAKAQKAEQVRLAKAEARAKAAQREEARLEALADAAEARKRAQLMRLAHALAHAVTGHAQPAPVEQAKAEHKHGRAAAREARLEQASLKARKRHDAHVVAAAHPHPRTEVVPPPPPSGLMRVSTTPRCASRDPGAALVCADPGLSAAERQLTRAYQGARAAGVPDEELQMGQQRWLAARSAAAREAPWAVRDVYMARIAELNGQAKEAQGGY
jgi:hypothetical protein